MRGHNDMNMWLELDRRGMHTQIQWGNPVGKHSLRRLGEGRIILKLIL